MAASRPEAGIDRTQTELAWGDSDAVVISTGSRAGRSSSRAEGHS